MAKKGYTFISLAEAVLVKTGHPMTPQEIWEKAQADGLADKVGTKGQTPWESISAQLYVSVRDDPSTVFVKAGKTPSKFYVKGLSASKARVKALEAVRAEEAPVAGDVEDEDLSADGSVPRVGKYPYKERELHPHVARFAHFGFKGVYCKTIFHETSSKKTTRSGSTLIWLGFGFLSRDTTRSCWPCRGRGCRSPSSSRSSSNAS